MNPAILVAVLLQIALVAAVVIGAGYGLVHFALPAVVRIVRREWTRS
jgi:hypothetical protein